MDYKKIFKSRDLRLNIIDALGVIPDRTMVKIQYRVKTGRKLNLDNPKRYSEKLQYYKLFYRNQLMRICADKYMVREYVKKCGYEHILNPIIGIYKNADDIDFAGFPQSFVVKDTLGWGSTSVIIVEEKNKANLNRIKEVANRWIIPRRKHPGREWVYEKRRNRILIEQYIPSNKENGGLIDYKFFCFDGKVKYLYVIADRIMGYGAGLAIYDRSYNKLPYLRADERPLEREIIKPENYEEMISIAERLSKPFPHARIDLYNQKGKITFGEITFFDGSGYMLFEPDKFDFILGREFILPEKRGI